MQSMSSVWRQFITLRIPYVCRRILTESQQRNSTCVIPNVIPQLRDGVCTWIIVCFIICVLCPSADSELIPVEYSPAHSDTPMRMRSPKFYIPTPQRNMYLNYRPFRNSVFWPILYVGGFWTNIILVVL